MREVKREEGEEILDWVCQGMLALHVATMTELDTLFMRSTMACNAVLHGSRSM